MEENMDDVKDESKIDRGKLPKVKKLTLNKWTKERNTTVSKSIREKVYREPVTISIPSTLHDALREIAERDTRNISNTIEIILKDNVWDYL